MLMDVNEEMFALDVTVEVETEAADLRAASFQSCPSW
jgi:hypothetical protein